MTNPGGTEPSADLREPFMLAPTARPPGSGDRRRLWFGVSVGGLMAVLAAGGLVLLLGFGGSGGPTVNGRQFELNGCVRSNGSDAVAINCEDAGSGDYRITEIAESIAECPDETMPTVRTGPRIYCLKPYGD